MLKLIFCLKRLRHLSREDFQRYWREQHAPLVAKQAATVSVRRCVQSLTVDDLRLAQAAEVRGSAGKEFDGVAELWWDSADALVAALSTESGRLAGQELLADEARFIDLPNSPILLSEENVVIG